MFPVEQIVYVPCLGKVIAPNKLVSAGDEMKDVLRVCGIVRRAPDLTLRNVNRKFCWRWAVSSGKVIKLSGEAVGSARCERGPQTRYLRGP